MSDWRPIETAPEDGRDVLLFCMDGTYEVGHYGAGGWQRLDWFLLDPSHWMPLPDPPKADPRG